MSVNCSHCETQLSPEYIFDNCLHTENYGFPINCPNCNKMNSFKVSEGVLEIGGIDGFPGPVWIIDSSMKIKGLRSERVSNGFNIYMGGKEWLIPYPPRTEEVKAETTNNIVRNAINLLLENSYMGKIFRRIIFFIFFILFAFFIVLKK